MLEILFYIEVHVQIQTGGKGKRTSICQIPDVTEDTTGNYSLYWENTRMLLVLLVPSL